MKLLLIPIKNIIQNMGRAFSLGFFIFISSCIFIVCNSIIGTVSENSKDALIHGLTGDIQIRNVDVEQEDFVDMNTSWQNAEYLTKEEVDIVMNYLDSHDIGAQVNQRIRHAGALTIGESYSDVLMIGIEDDDVDYQKSFVLDRGKYIQAGEENQVVLSKETAEKLEVEVGDTIYANSLNIHDKIAMLKVTVVGIGEFESLAGYGNNMCFMDKQSVKQIKGLAEGEATEIILRGIDKKKVGTVVSKLNQELNTNDRYLITSWKTQGGYVKVINTMITVIFYVFMAILILIICLSIGNMVSVIAIERVREIGTMRAIGFSRKRVSFLFVLEILLIAVMASLVGCIVASIACLIISNQTINVGNPMNIILGSEFTLKYSFISSIPGLIAFILLGCLAAYSPIKKMNKNQLVELINNDF